MVRQEGGENLDQWRPGGAVTPALNRQPLEDKETTCLSCCGVVPVTCMQMCPFAVWPSVKVKGTSFIILPDKPGSGHPKVTEALGAEAPSSQQLP